MRRSNYFIPLSKEVPAEAHVISHQLMLRAGMIYQTAAGIYSWLPFGLKVLENIEKIIEEEHAKINCQKILMPTIQPAALWEESGRYDAYGKEMLRITDRHDRPLLYSPTAEEAVTDIARQYVNSYRQLPLSLYQIGWKFRDEIRPRFGVMRGREFLMKDAYSFDMTEKNAQETFERFFDCYISIFDRLFDGIFMEDNQPLKAVPVLADSGAIGGSYSYEFQIPALSGESQLYYDRAYHDIKERNYKNLKDLYAAADEKHDPSKIPAENIITKRGIEVGHVFLFGDKYSRSMNLKVPDASGAMVYPEMGSYGIGVSRLVGAIIEASHDKFGIIWPKSVAPYKIGLINLLDTDPSHAENLYASLQNQNVEVLYDDRPGISPGVKFSEMDLIGVPVHIVVGRNYLENQSFEVKIRRNGEKKQMNLEEILQNLKEF